MVNTDGRDCLGAMIESPLRRRQLLQRVRDARRIPINMCADTCEGEFGIAQ